MINVANTRSRHSLRPAAWVAGGHPAAPGNAGREIGRYSQTGNVPRCPGYVCFGVCLLLLALALPVTRATASGKSPDLTLQTLQSGSVSHSFYVHEPASARTAKRRAVVLILHGGGKADGDETAARTGFWQLADQHGFLAVYPNGVDSQWNDGRGKTYKRAAGNTDNDDVGFIADLIDVLVADFAADADRIYVTGLSNGGMMTLRLGCELDEKIAAIAPVIASMPKNISATCAPAGPLPVLLMNGTDDPIVPWNGGDVRVFRKSLGAVLSTQATV